MSVIERCIQGSDVREELKADARAELAEYVKAKRELAAMKAGGVWLGRINVAPTANGKYVAVLHNTRWRRWEIDGDTVSTTDGVIGDVFDLSQSRTEAAIIGVRYWLGPLPTPTSSEGRDDA